jgi:hypothetical protein
MAGNQTDARRRAEWELRQAQDCKADPSHRQTAGRLQRSQLRRRQGDGEAALGSKRRIDDAPTRRVEPTTPNSVHSPRHL